MKYSAQGMFNKTMTGCAISCFFIMLGAMGMRSPYFLYLLFIGVGLILWFIVANETRQGAAEKEADKDYLTARIKTQNIYCAALANAIGANIYQAAAAEAMKDPAYQAAKATEETKRLVHYVASKDAKGGT